MCEPGVALRCSRRHRVTDGRAHPLHLVLAALVQRQLEHARGGCGREQRASAVRLARPRARRRPERPERILGPGALDLGLVDLRDAVARMGEPVRERPSFVSRGRRSYPRRGGRPAPRGIGGATRSTTVGRPCGSRAVVTTPAGLCRRTYASRCGATRDRRPRRRPPADRVVSRPARRSRARDLRRELVRSATGGDAGTREVRVQRIAHSPAPVGCPRAPDEEWPEGSQSSRCSGRTSSPVSSSPSRATSGRSR